jgi:hypothetical protein
MPDKKLPIHFDFHRLNDKQLATAMEQITALEAMADRRGQPHLGAVGKLAAPIFLGRAKGTGKKQSLEVAR